jgi:hypothetical protein
MNSLRFISFYGHIFVLGWLLFEEEERWSSQGVVTHYFLWAICPDEDHLSLSNL